MRALAKAKNAASAVQVKRGDEIFEGTDYPRTWDGFIGQEQAVEHLRTTVASAKHRGAKLDHILLASGQPGIGKTTLAMIIAAEMGVGLVSVSGAMTNVDFQRAISMCESGDIIFWDEFHLAVAGNRNRADWLLPFMTDGVLLTKQGRIPVPDVTLIAATTDVGKLPQTVITRFMVQPRLAAYTEAEAIVICRALAARMKIRLSGSQSAADKIARAANNNPRVMRQILVCIRDLAALGPVDLDKAFEWAGVSADGLSREALDIMVILLGSPSYTASLETIQGTLSEPGPLRHVEAVLLQRGYLTISGRGRTLTEDGIERAKEALT
jgi:Holliday junction DNA helicase RuvB